MCVAIACVSKKVAMEGKDLFRWRAARHVGGLESLGVEAEGCTVSGECGEEA